MYILFFNINNSVEIAKIGSREIACLHVSLIVLQKNNSTTVMPAMQAVEQVQNHALSGIEAFCLLAQLPIWKILMNSDFDFYLVTHILTHLSLS